MTKQYKSSNNQLFLPFLGMLREKYLNASKDRDVTFHSVILAGLHDVKNLKIKLRPDEKAVNFPHALQMKMIFLPIRKFSDLPGYS